MLILAINDLKARIEETVFEIVDSRSKDTEDLKQDLYALVSSINVLEIYQYGKHQTKYTDYVSK